VAIACLCRTLTAIDVPKSGSDHLMSRTVEASVVLLIVNDNRRCHALLISSGRITKLRG
jgi:hypothetical protein